MMENSIRPGQHQLKPYIACQSYTSNNGVREMTPEIDWGHSGLPILINRRRIMIDLSSNSLTFLKREWLMGDTNKTTEERNNVITQDRRWVEKNYPPEMLQALHKDEIDLYLHHGVEGWSKIDFESLCVIFCIKPSQLVWITSIYNINDTMPIPNELGVRVVFDNYWEKSLARFIIEEQDSEGKFQEQIRRIEENSPRTMLATMYARRVRPQRTMLTAKMHEYNLLDKIYWSYGIAIEGNKGKSFNISVRKEIDKFNKMDNIPLPLIKDESIDWITSLTKNQYADEHRLVKNLAFGNITWSHTYNTKMMIINETIPSWPDQTIAPFLSEKSYKPFAAGQPFVMLGDANTVMALKQEGYKTFDGWINHFYDSIDDSSERFYQLSLEIKRLSEIPEREWTTILRQMLPDIQYNRKLFLSTVKKLYFRCR